MDREGHRTSSSSSGSSFPQPPRERTQRGAVPSVRRGVLTGPVNSAYNAKRRQGEGSCGYCTWSRPGSGEAPRCSPRISYPRSTGRRPAAAGGGSGPALHGRLRSTFPSPPASRRGQPVPVLPLQPGAVLALRRLVRDWRPDLIQAHGGEPLKYAGRGDGRRWAPHRLPADRITVSWLSNRSRPALYGRLVRRAARVVAVAESIRQETIEAFRLPPAQVVTIPNGVDPRRLEPRPGQGGDPGGARHPRRRHGGAVAGRPDLGEGPRRTPRRERAAPAPPRGGRPSVRRRRTTAA